MVVTIGRKRRNVDRKKSPRYVIRSMREMRTMRLYLRRPSRGRRAGGARMGPPSAVGSNGLMLGVSLLEDAGDDLVERRVLHAHVEYRIALQDGAQDLGDPAAVHLEIDDRPTVADDLAEAVQVVRRLALAE